MSTSVHTLHAPTALQRFVFAVVAALRSGAAAWQRSRRRRAALRELQSLDDHILHDIGIHRSELGSLVAEVIGAAPATRRAAMRSLP
ncbi:MAG: hypothetical protein H6R06_2730 [Proteobacteria bacterium]|nr:hypothetical protein [Pseudomonadota bacterium]